MDTLLLNGACCPNQVSNETLGRGNLREALHVPDEAIRAQLARTEELREARLVGTRELQPIEVGFRLKKGEVCYQSTPFVEKKLRISRTYQVDGVRHQEKELATERSGHLYVTSQRVLLVSGGTTTIKLDSVIDAAVAADESLLALTVDGRKTPYYLELEKPFVVAAYLDRVLGL